MIRLLHFPGHGRSQRGGGVCEQAAGPPRIQAGTLIPARTNYLTIKMVNFF